MLFAWAEEEEEGAMAKAKLQGTPIIFFGDSAIKKERLFIYNDTSKTIKIKFETPDTTKRKVAYNLITEVESTSTKITYPKSGYDTIMTNEIKEIRLDSIPVGKYTLECKLKIKTIKNKKEVITENSYSLSILVRKKKLEITTKDLMNVFTDNKDTAQLGQVARTINKYSEEFGIVNKNRMAHFVAQVGYESGSFKGKKGEGGCYSKTNPNWEYWFDKKWTEPPFCNDCDNTLNLPIVKGKKKLRWTAIECKSSDKDCVPVPDNFICKQNTEEHERMFLSYVYQCEGGNGNSSTGDGYTYRGHGAIQLTWKKTYEAFDKWLKNNHREIYKDVLADPSVIDEDMELYILSAMWFWGVEKKYEDLNKLADEDDIEKITKVISNSLDTKDNRKKILEKIKNELK
jgi:predicted chitinase